MEGKRELKEYLFQSYDEKKIIHQNNKTVQKLIEELPYPDEDFSISSLSPQKEEATKVQNFYENNHVAGRLKTQSNHTYDTNSNDEITPAGSLRGSFTPNCMHKFMDWSKQNVNMEGSKNIFPQVTGPSIDIYSQDNFNLIEDSDHKSSKRNFPRKNSRPSKQKKKIGTDSILLAQKINELTQENQNLLENLERQNALVNGYRKRLNDVELDCEHLVEIRKESEKEKNEILKSVNLLKDQLLKKDELVAKLQTKMTDLEANLSKVLKENNKLNSKLEILEAPENNINKSNMVESSYDEELQKLKIFYEKEISKLKSKEKELRDELKNSKEEIQKFKNHSISQKSVNTTESENDAREKEIQIVQNSEINSLKNQIGNLQMLYKEEKKKKENLEIELTENQNQTEKACNELIAEISQLKNELQRKEKYKEKENKKWDELKESMELYQKQFEQLEKANSNLLIEFKSIEEKNLQLAFQKENLEAENQKKEIEFQTLTIKFQKLSAENTKIKEELNRKNLELNEIKKEIGLLKADINEFYLPKESLQKVESSLKAKEREIEDAISQIHELNEKNQDSTKLLRDLEEKNKVILNLQQLNEEMKAKYRELNEIFTEFQNDSEKTQKSYLKGLEEKYENQIKEKDKKCIELFKENKLLNEKLYQSEEKVKAFQNQIEVKHKALTQKSNEVKSLLEKIKDLSKQNESLEKQIASPENPKVTKLQEKIMALERSLAANNKAFDDCRKEKEHLIKSVIDLQTESQKTKEKLTQAVSPLKGKSSKFVEKNSNLGTTNKASRYTPSIVEMFQPELMSNDDTLLIISKILQKIVKSKEMIRKISENKDFRNFSLKLIQNSFDTSELMSNSKEGRDSLYERYNTAATPTQWKISNKGLF